MDTEQVAVPAPPAPRPADEVLSGVYGRRVIVATSHVMGVAQDPDTGQVREVVETTHCGVRGDAEDPYLRASSDVFTDASKRLYVRVVTEQAWDEWMTSADPAKPASCPRAVAHPAYLVFVDSAR